MTDPNFRDHRIYMVPLLRVLRGRGAVAPKEVYGEVAERAGLTAAQRAATSHVDGAVVYKNRIQFARQSLIDAGLIIGSSEQGWQHGRWELNAAAEQLVASIPTDARLDAEVRARAADGLRRRTQARQESVALAGLMPALEAPPTGLAEELDRPIVPEDALPRIEGLVAGVNESAFSAMLDHIRSMHDTAFEHLVGDVLMAALRADSVRVTQRSRDGGIDGILQFDSLGIRTAVFEAKRYGAGNTVSRPQLDAFATAARRMRASHALFVTSSAFSVEAVAAARDEAVRLIDGVAFVRLMAENSLGLKPMKTFVVYDVDPAWSVLDDDA